jgi:hypothetical protein
MIPIETLIGIRMKESNGGGDLSMIYLYTEPL